MFRFQKIVFAKMTKGILFEFFLYFSNRMIARVSGPRTNQAKSVTRSMAIIMRLNSNCARYTAVTSEVFFRTLRASHATRGENGLCSPTEQCYANKGFSPFSRVYKFIKIIFKCCDGKKLEGNFAR